MKEVTHKQMGNIIRGLAGRGMTEDQLTSRFERPGFTVPLAEQLIAEI